MESSLTEREIEAVVQLIQLSGDCGDGFHVFWVDFRRQKEEEESVGETSSSASALVDPENLLDTEVLPRMKIRVGSISDIYGKTEQPLIIKNRRRKRVRRYNYFVLSCCMVFPLYPGKQLSVKILEAPSEGTNLF